MAGILKFRIVNVELRIEKRQELENQRLKKAKLQSKNQNFLEPHYYTHDGSRDPSDEICRSFIVRAGNNKRRPLK